MLKIVIADDHPIFRTGLASTVDGMFDNAVVREAGQYKSLIKTLQGEAADLLTLDIFFPGLEPEIHIRELRRAHPLMAILIVSMLLDRSAIERVMRAGANGFVSKTASPDSLKRGLVEVLDGERPVYLPTSGRSRAHTSGDDPLSALPKRQLEVLRFICLGFSNKEIARELELSTSTVRAHIEALFKKLGVSNRAAAASYGASRGVTESL